MRFFNIILSFISVSWVVCVAKLSTDPTEVADKVFKTLDVIENGATTAWQWTKAHRNLIKSLAGSFMLFYGGQFGHSFVFMQALSVSGWPVITKSLRELSATYTKTRNVLKQDMPDILKAQAEYSEFNNKIGLEQTKIKNAKASLKSGDVSADKYKDIESKANERINDLKLQMRKISAISGTFSHIKAAINPTHIQELISGIYQAVILGVAAVSSKTVATLTQGLSMGKIAYDRIFKLFGNIAESHKESLIVSAANEFVSTHQEWVQIAGKIITRSLGVLIAYFLESATTVYSVCSFAGDVITNAAEDLIDPILILCNLPTIKNTPHAAAMLHTSLTAIGVKAQLMPGGSGAGIPLILKVFLAPLIGLEFFLSNLVLKKPSV